MADFEYGKLDFSTSFNPTSAFPLDARSLFSDLASAQAAAATAEEPGSTNTKYHYGQKLCVVNMDDKTAKWYTIQPDNTLLEDGSGSAEFTTDETLSFKDGVLKVNTAAEVEADNTLPITSAAVHTAVGNIEILLSTI